MAELWEAGVTEAYRLAVKGGSATRKIVPAWAGSY